jgi:serine/threonine-protein kinase
MSPSDRLAVPERYQVLEQVGLGGSSIVYKALDRRTNQLVALKLQSANASIEDQQLWQRMSHLMAALDHPGLVRMLDWGEAAGRGYLVFEWIEGQTLAQALQQTPRLSLRQAVFVACAVLRALEALHARGVIHRDVKPANIFLSPEPGRPEHLQVKLGDLGVAHTDEDPVPAVGENSGIAGTPAYMPPEQWNQGGQVGPWSDLYALGCVLYEMLCGQRPFAGSTFVALLMHHTTAPRPDPRGLRPEIPQTLANLIVRLMALPCADRPGSAAAAREELEAIQLPL